jgi:hypothetical protein
MLTGISVTRYGFISTLCKLYVYVVSIPFTFPTHLSATIRLCGLDLARYNGHSLRVGAASYAARRGMSDPHVRLMGRWKSNAFHKYIGISSMST